MGRSARKDGRDGLGLVSVGFSPSGGSLSVGSSPEGVVESEDAEAGEGNLVTEIGSSVRLRSSGVRVDQTAERSMTSFVD